MNNKFYVYAWYNTDTNEVFYVGKGCGRRYKEKHNRRNQLFLDYVQTHPTDSKILMDHLEEQTALTYEKQYVDFYKEKGECFCNLAEAGHGGLSQVWTDEWREYWSENNPMKADEQRERMKQNNPMKDKDIAKRVGAKHKTPIFIGDKRFDGLIDAAKFYSRTSTTIQGWVRKGISPKGEKCGYLNNTGKPKQTKKGKPVLIDGERFPSIIEAAINKNLPLWQLKQVLSSNTNYCQGHFCEYANQQPS